MFPGYATLVPHVAALLAYLAGLAVAIFLLVRSRGRAAILAAVGFGLLTLISLGQIVLILPPVSGQFFRIGQWLAWVLNCCCSIFDIAAITCLIVAIWQAVSGTEPLEEEVIVDVFDQVPGEAPSATMVLEERLEGEILEDTPAKSPYATRVLRETQEEAIEESE